MDLSKTFATDANLEENGVWVALGEGSKIKVARMNNKAYRKCFERLAKPYLAQIRSKSLPDEIAEKLLLQALAETILVDWENISDMGQDLPFSVENGLKMMTKYRDFRDQVALISNEMESFRVQEKLENREEATKN